ncbi:MerR family transcriptional regulator [Enterococcus sp. LJL128]
MIGIYSIGQVAAFLGISKDQLRYYEKKKVFVPSQNRKNLYREYTSEDIDKILAIDFYRSLDLDFKTITQINSQTDLEELGFILEEKQKKLAAEIENLRASQRQIEKIQQKLVDIKQHLHRYSIKKFPAQKIVGTFSDFRAYEEFSIVREVAEERAKLTQLKRFLSFDDTGVTDSQMLITKLAEHTDTVDVLSFNDCVYTIIEDGGEQLDVMAQIFSKTQKYMADNGLRPIGKAIIGLLLLANENNKTKSYLEIYVPYHS